jgi:hypothetical protein
MNHSSESPSQESTSTRSYTVRRIQRLLPKTPGRMEHRWGERFELRAAVRLHCVTREIDGHLKDVSLSGAFVHTRLQVPPWTQIELELSGRRIAAYVVRVAADGLGIEWSEFAPRAIRVLLSL